MVRIANILIDVGRTGKTQWAVGRLVTLEELYWSKPGRTRDKGVGKQKRSQIDERRGKDM
jgi:hypothetical protein